MGIGSFSMNQLDADDIFFTPGQAVKVAREGILGIHRHTVDVRYLSKALNGEEIELRLCGERLRIGTHGWQLSSGDADGIHGH